VEAATRPSTASDVRKLVISGAPVALVVKQDVPADPRDVDAFGPAAVVASAKRRADAIEQAGRAWFCFAHHERVVVPAVSEAQSARADLSDRHLTSRSRAGESPAV